MEQPVVTNSDTIPQNADAHVLLQWVQNHGSTLMPPEPGTEWDDDVQGTDQEMELGDKSRARKQFQLLKAMRYCKNIEKLTDDESMIWSNTMRALEEELALVYMADFAVHWLYQPKKDALAPFTLQEFASYIIEDYDLDEQDEASLARDITTLCQNIIHGYLQGGTYDLTEEPILERKDTGYTFTRSGRQYFTIVPT